MSTHSHNLYRLMLLPQHPTLLSNSISTGLGGGGAGIAYSYSLALGESNERYFDELEVCEEADEAFEDEAASRRVEVTSWRKDGEVWRVMRAWVLRFRVGAWGRAEGIFGWVVGLVVMVVVVMVW